MAQAHEADPSLISRLTVLVQDQGNSLEVRDASARGLVEIAGKHPDYRQQCIAILTATLERYPRNPIELNTSLISHLIELKAKESATMIQQAVRAGEYDEKLIGGWQEISRELGVFQPSPPSPAPPQPPASMLSSAAVDPAAAFLSPDPARAAATISSAPHLTDKQREKLRAKRKAERKAKKQNRRQ
jgi:hypothetical protein